MTLTQLEQFHKDLVLNFTQGMARMCYVWMLSLMPDDETRKNIHKELVKAVRDGIISAWASPEASKKAKAQNLDILMALMGTNVQKEQETIIDKTDEFIEKFIDPILKECLDNPG